jgi:HSP20 family molecular chaperone IbpA
MSHTVANPDLPVNHHADDVAASKTDSKLTANHSEPEAALLKTLDHFRTSFMTHFYELAAPLYGHHLNMKPSFYSESHLKGSSSHNRKYDSLEERRIHPFVDMWETKTDYFADIEMPGIENKDSITVQWTTPRTILIEVIISRPRIEGWDTKVGGLESEAGDKGDEGELNWIAHERRIGKVVRILLFPTDVDMVALRAQLVTGLLRIKVPKRFSGFEGWKVEVA